MVKRRCKINLVVALILAPCLIGLGGFWFYFFHYLDPTIAFDSTKWKANPSELSYNPIRLCMVDDFLKSHHPVGKSRAEIVALLGEPDFFRNYEMVYILEQGFDEWSELRLNLNSANIVIEARLTTD